MISKAKIKFIRQLEHKKARRELGLFVAEGPKVVGDLLAAMQPRLVVATDSWMQGKMFAPEAEVVTVTDEELRRVSFLMHPQEVLAVFPIPSGEKAFMPHADELMLALDGVQDPGNLGTIIRIADWFGINHIYCSPDTADVWNPKVVQATMGSIARVTVGYGPLQQLISALPDGYPVYGTLLDGHDLYAEALTATGLIIMGNEGNGISVAIRQLVNRRLLIPNYPPGRPTADSLNVAIATAVTCAEFRRRSF